MFDDRGVQQLREVRFKECRNGSPRDRESKRVRLTYPMSWASPQGLSDAAADMNRRDGPRQIVGVLGISGRMMGRPAVNQPPRIPTR